MRRVTRVECVVAGQHRHQAAGAGQLHRLGQEMVVHHVVVRVVQRVMEPDISKRHVPDHRVEVPARQAGLGKRLGTNPRRWIQQGGDGGGGRVELDAHHRHRLRGGPDEHPRPTARLQRPPPSWGAELDQRVPDRAGILHMRVVRVDRGAARRIVGGRVQQLPQHLAPLRMIGAGLVEDLRQALRPPRPPPGQHLLLPWRRRPALGLHPAQDPDRGHVGIEPGHRPRRRQTFLPPNPKPHHRAGHRPGRGRGSGRGRGWWGGGYWSSIRPVLSWIAW